MRPDPDEMGPDAEDLGRVVDILSTMNQEDSWRDEVPGDLWAGIEVAKNTPLTPMRRRATANARSTAEPYRACSASSAANARTVRMPAMVSSATSPALASASCTSRDNRRMRRP